jgi:hypothetical protein
VGFYIRKSLRAGPFRFNLSKSGLGVSAGVPGFRVGTGPRGNYVHVGRGGVYYRASLGAKAGTRAGGHAPAVPQPVFTPQPEILMEDVTGVSAAAFEPTGSGDLVQQLNDASSRVATAPWVVGLLIIVLLTKPVVGAILLAPGLPGAFWLWQRDRARRSVVAFYDVNDAPAQWFTQLVDTFADLAQMGGAWRINASGRISTTYQYKVNSGASALVNRVGAAFTTKGPKVLVTNIAVPTISAGRQALHFLPDRLLVREGRRFSDVAYGRLQLSCDLQRFIESGRVPRDAQQVDVTWQYVNVKGGPDRRFKNNRQLPVMLYGRIEIGSQNGLNWVLDCSRPNTAQSFRDVLGSAPVLAAAVPA